MSVLRVGKEYYKRHETVKSAKRAARSEESLSGSLSESQSHLTPGSTDDCGRRRSHILRAVMRRVSPWPAASSSIARSDPLVLTLAGGGPLGDAARHGPSPEVILPPPTRGPTPAPSGHRAPPHGMSHPPLPRSASADAVSVATTAPAQHLLTTEITNAVGSSSAKLFRTHNYRKPRPLGLRFRLVLTEEHTERLEWQM